MMIKTKFRYEPISSLNVLYVDEYGDEDYLAIHGCRLKEIDPSVCWDKFPNLRKLDISNNYLTSLHLYSAKNLIYLKADKNYLEEITLPPSIKKLYLQSNRITNLKTEELTQLTDLNVKNNQILDLDLSNNEKVDTVIMDALVLLPVYLRRPPRGIKNIKRTGKSSQHIDLPI